MAFEVKVFREITAYRARIFFGLPTRVAVVGSLTLILCVGLFVAGCVYDFRDLAQWIIVAVAILATLACVRPQGLAMETYLGYIGRYYERPRIYTCSQEGRSRHETRPRGRAERDKIALLEAHN